LENNAFTVFCSLQLTQFNSANKLNIICGQTDTDQRDHDRKFRNNAFFK